MPTRALILMLGLCLGATLARAQNAGEVCLACHEDQAKKIKTSTHAAQSCARCHPKHEEYPHPAGTSKPACGQCHTSEAGEQARSAHAEAFRKGNAAAPTCAVCHGEAHEMKPAKSAEFHKAVPDTCGMCHTEITEHFRASVHGAAVAKGVADAPVCTTCHGEHSIISPAKPQSYVYHSHVPETCGQCHGNVRLSKKFGLPADRIVSFGESFHGLATRAGSQSVANCASCHGVHDILPSSDPKSKTNAKNLPSTCGSCHPGAGQRFALGPVHQVNGKGEPSLVLWARAFYLIVIPLTIGFMLLHNLGDWLRKLGRRFRRSEAQNGAAALPALRMHGLERIQHALLAVSFIVLTWTGLALKYPEEWWARPLVAWESWFPVRGTIHRAAAVIFMAVGFMHVISLIASRRLRRHWTTLVPRRADAAEALGMFAYNMGVRNRRPILSEHSYIEKAEYWAVAWGSVVMVLTGVVLWANNLSLQWLPKSVIDFATAVHLYEAILAALAIVVWHFYSVCFDPDVYPLDTAFLTGYSVRRRESAPHGESAEPAQPAPVIEEHDPVT